MGSIWGDEELQDRSLTVLQALRAETQPRLTMVDLAAAALLLGVTLSGCLQWVIVGGVGPMTSVLGGGITGVVLSGLTWLVSAELVAWHTGGFDHERGARPRRP